jgi:hypothetical protein
MKKIIICLFFFNLYFSSFSQNHEQDILNLEFRLIELNAEIDSVLNLLEDLKLIPI